MYVTQVIDKDNRMKSWNRITYEAGSSNRGRIPDLFIQLEKNYNNERIINNYWGDLEKVFKEDNSEELLKMDDRFNVIKKVFQLFLDEELIWSMRREEFRYCGSIASNDDKDKIFININNDVEWEYMVYRRGSMIRTSPMKEINQYRYKAEWLTLDINRSLRMNIVDVDIVMKEFNSDISWINNESIHIWICQENITTVNQIINVAYEKLKETLETTGVKVDHRLHANLFYAIKEFVMEIKEIARKFIWIPRCEAVSQWKFN
ncbi:hypothetical protein RhiirA4_479284 [Rhizophagus irregularis]|uniref:Uncharacterized protein n=1 Tax=Rhizophagus irregularis TaxID=588596 RepID=A0A2I1HGD4_9GLOM|nr:hypothetical protein RhiirA4_479284 [Rhizophagus irregularis]